MSNLSKLINSFSETLNIEEKEVTDSLSYGNHPWDSVAHMAIVASIETSFDLMLETDDIIAMSSFGKAKEIVRKHGIDIKS